MFFFLENFLENFSVEVFQKYIFYVTLFVVLFSYYSIITVLCFRRFSKNSFSFCSSSVATLRLLPIPILSSFAVVLSSVKIEIFCGKYKKTLRKHCRQNVKVQLLSANFLSLFISLHVRKYLFTCKEIIIYV